MSLPPEFTDDEQYFEAFMSFLTHYRELYWRSNTDVLTDNLEFHVNLIDNDTGSYSEDYLSDTSQTFLRELSKLSPYYESFSSNENERSTVKIPMSEKKAHEIIHLTEEIKEMCQIVDCQTVVDLGAGLGYIDINIFKSTGFNVLGLEGQEGFYVNCKEHQRKYHPESLDKVKFIRHFVSENSDTNVDSFLRDKFPNEEKGFCCMGLHACGDLTVSAMRLFLKMQNCRALIVTPCCYHKMAPGTDDISRFKNFPLSQTLKKIFLKFDAHTFIDVPFLRVAAQPAHVTDQDIEQRVFYLLARALLKVYAKKYNCVVQKKRRKPVRISNTDFASYAKEATTRGFSLKRVTTLDNNESGEEKREIAFDLTELQSMWEEIPKTTFTNAALYISYQNHLPAIFENFILYDRLVYLKENGVECCYYKKVVNEKKSPKCLSLCASKNYNANYLNN